jgi:PmbA protein
MIERALETATKRAQGAEIWLGRIRSTTADYEDDRLKHVEVTQSTRLSVRVIVNGNLGSARCTDEAAVESTVERAIELAEFGSEAKFDFPGPAAAPEVKTYDPQVEAIPKEDLVAAGAEMLELVKSYNDEIKVFGGAWWNVEERRLVNSSGLDLTSQGSAHSIAIGGLLVRGTDMLYVHYDRGWRRPVLATREVAERAIEQFRLAEPTASLDSKTMPVIFSPRGAHVLLLSLLMGVNGKNVLKGDSPLANRMGEKLAPEGFSLVDDATHDYALASGAWDWEGVPRRRTEIVTNGQLNAFLYDLETAGKAGTESTGHGPGCGTSNVIIPAGDTSFADMLAGTSEGLLVEHVMGLGQSNAMNGDFSVNVSLGYKIENGEIVGRVKDAMLAGNVYDALPQIEAIGSEPEWTWGQWVPPIKVGSLSVVAKE